MVRLKRFGLFFVVFLAVMLFGLGCGNPSVEGGTLIGNIGNVAGYFDIISIDATTGSTSIIATLSPEDPDSVPDCGFAVDSVNEKAYIAGDKLVGDVYVNKIYTIDLSTPVPHAVTDATLSGPGAGGDVFDFYKTDTLIGPIVNNITKQWEIISIDATTGETSIIATLPSGDPDEVIPCGFAVDSANNKAYLCGSNGTQYKIYTIDLITGISSSVTLSGPGAGGFVFDFYKTDTLIGNIGNVGTGSFEIISIDATTGSTSIIATLSPEDPDSVPDCGFAVDSANNKAYLCGDKLEGSAYVNKIYTIDLITGASSSVTLSGPGAGGFCFDVYNK